MAVSSAVTIFYWKLSAAVSPGAPRSYGSDFSYVPGLYFQAWPGLAESCCLWTVSSDGWPLRRPQKTNAASGLPARRTFQPEAVSTLLADRALEHAVDFL